MVRNILLSVIIGICATYLPIWEWENISNQIVGMVGIGWTSFMLITGTGKSNINSGRRRKEMIYRIEYAGGRCHNFAASRADLFRWLKLLKEEEISDIRKIRKNGSSDSVLHTYKKYIEKVHNT